MLYASRVKLPATPTLTVTVAVAPPAVIVAPAVLLVSCQKSALVEVKLTPVSPAQRLKVPVIAFDWLGIGLTVMACERTRLVQLPEI